jgi:hypothetical protein
MGKLTDVAIRAWIKAGERFEGRTDGDGLLLSWRPDRTAPHWRLRYRFAGKSRVMNLGSYTDLPLAAARQSAKELRACHGSAYTGQSRVGVIRPAEPVGDDGWSRHIPASAESA